MKTIIEYVEPKKKSVTEICSFTCDIAPQVGDEVRVPDTEGIFVDAVVVYRMFDFTDKKEASLRVGCSKKVA